MPVDRSAARSDPLTVAEPVSRTYRLAMGVCAVAVRRWGRLEVSGLEHLPGSGPVLLAANHDSYWDPVAIGIAALPRRQIRALAKSSMWKVHGLGPILDAMGQIPIERGAGDARALDRAVSELARGACIGVFPEGTRSLGRTLRARSGLGRLALAVPQAPVICATVQGTVDIARFPRRPRVRVRFFVPAANPHTPLEAPHPADLPVRLLAEIRRHAPIAAAGRRTRTGQEPPARAQPPT